VSAKWILLLWLNKLNGWAQNRQNKKLQYSGVTFKSLRQKEVTLTLVQYCINQFDGGFLRFPFPVMSRWNVNPFMSTQISLCSMKQTACIPAHMAVLTYSHLTNFITYCTWLTWRYYKWLIPYTKISNKNKKFKKDPQLSCVKISGLFQNLGNMLMESLLRVYFYWKCSGLKVYEVQGIISGGAEVVT
jgi:hypothetical protein